MARRLLKRLFLISALLTILLLFSWPHLTQRAQKSLSASPQITTIPLDKKKMRAQIKSLQLQGRDKHQQAYQLDAQQVVESSEALLELTQPQLSIQLSSGNHVSLAAKHGFFDKKSQTLTLKESVTLTHSHGYTLHTSTAIASLDDATVYSHAPLTGQGPQGRLHASQGFQFDYTIQELTLLGRPCVTHISSSHAPLTIQADQILCQEGTQHRCIALGNAYAESRSTPEHTYTLSAEKLYVYFHMLPAQTALPSSSLKSRREIRQIDAINQVAFTKAPHQVFCQRAQYHVSQEEILLSGSVKIQHGRSTLEGKEGKIHLKDGTYSVTNQTAPIEAFLYPKDFSQLTEKTS